MDVFDLGENTLDQYAKFARSFTKIRSREIQVKVDQLYQERRFWPEPLIQLNPHYESGGSIRDLVGEGGLAPECAQIFRDPRPGPNDADHSLKLRRHQAQAIGLALAGKSFVVTTGTGSGKSLCYFVPIVDAVLKAKRAGGGARTRALVVYPMNALANSQQEELRKFLGDADDPSGVTFARYTGQEGQDERERIKRNPPDILLTNFMMLELLMTRQSELDKRVIENCSGLRFVVLDELHTYRGRQGADVAMLMRRLRARVGDPDRPPVCVGTSATMASEHDEENRNQLVAEVASKLFGTTISRDAVVTETLKRGTDPSRSADRGLAGLGAAVDSAASGSHYLGLRNSEIADDPLAIWIETRLGLANVDSKPIRAHPKSLQEAAQALEKEAERPFDRAQAALKSALLALSLREKDRDVAGGLDEPLFAFKLHQFISGAGRLYATVDAPGHRTLTFDGQIFDPDHPNKRLYATHFCRNCGQEHHPVTLNHTDGTPQFEKREIDDVPVNEDDDPDTLGGRWGFLMPEPVDGQFDFQGRDEDYPDAWLEETKSGEMRLKTTYRKTRAELFSVLPDGLCEPGGQRAWFMPGRFKFCPACREHHTDSTRDINRLASLSAEGRSSATTIIIAAILRWMSGAETDLAAYTRKLLAFTDNRQDAALQAGHFNDFIFVTLLRGAILAALADAEEGGKPEDQMGAALQQALGFLAANTGRRLEWLVEPELKGASLLTAERAIREALAHRFWIDQRRGWRFTNPNLEQLGLIEARYVSLEEMAGDGTGFENAPPALRRATPEERERAARLLLDMMRRGLAVECDALDRLKIEGLTARMRSLIKAPWSLNEESIRASTTFMPRPPSRRDLKQREEDLILRGSPQSAIGRTFRTITFGGERPTSGEIPGIIEGLLQAATRYGLAVQVSSPVGGAGWRLTGTAITFRRKSGDATAERDNPYFRGLYEEIARLLAEGGAAIFGLEGREHTAQVESKLREIREARFRFGPDDQKALQDEAELLRELGEDGRFLPTLFCSPTMELGVDISAMNAVYMRNVPPTPANYAQRSGRAGRSGQAAFVVAYCAAQSPHDQYFFRQPRAMVDGIVRPPSIDLINPDLVESHLHAEWLAASGVDLDPAIAANLDMTATGKPLRPEHRDRVVSAAAKDGGIERTRAVLETLAADFGMAPPAWFSDPKSHAEKVVAEAPQRFEAGFDRWRDLLAAAERQVDDAARTLRDYSISPQERRAAEMRQAAGNTQVKLLLRGSESQGSDFYVYRYLATEGFLPGYNFPRLPLMAFVPGGRGGKGERYIQRARFLAISEFGPYSLVYHEGRAYRVDRALLKEAGGGPNGDLPTFSAAICPMCGAGHEGEAREECHVCDHPLAGCHIIRELHRIENVGTREAERITANDEERRRQGFDLQTTFSFAHSREVITRMLEDAVGEVLTAKFAPAALVRRINKGLRRRRNESEIGFWIDPRTGYWAAADDGDAEGTSPINARQRVTPVVEDRKNALLIRFPAGLRAAAGADADTVMATIQHALARGIETVYQLEEGEILAEPTPTKKERRALFFFEAAEGGAGALSRLISEKDGFRSIARAALESMHYAPGTFEEALASGPSALRSVPEARCVAGCYRCLLSYYNQPDHELIDRRNELALQFLLRLAHAEGRNPAQDARPTELPDDCPSPDPEPLTVDGVRIDLIWRAARLGAIEEDLGSHDLVERLAAKGVELIVLPRAAEARRAALARLAAALGSAP